MRGKSMGPLPGLSSQARWLARIANLGGQVTDTGLACPACWDAEDADQQCPACSTVCRLGELLQGFASDLTRVSVIAKVAKLDAVSPEPLDTTVALDCLKLLNRVLHKLRLDPKYLDGRDCEMLCNSVATAIDSLQPKEVASASPAR